MRQSNLADLGKHEQLELWFAPVVGVILAIVLASLGLTLDYYIDWQDAPMPVFVGEGDTARTLLSVIAGSVATLIALIFTILAVVIQLASSQYSPRALPTLLEDRPSHFTIGVFVTTFTYTVIILLGLRLTATGDNDLVSGISVTTAFVLAVISLGTFAVYSNHIIHSVRVTSIIDRIGESVRSVVEKLYVKPYNGPEAQPELPDGQAPRHSVRAPRPGVLVDVDDDTLFELTRTHGGTIAVAPPIGAFVPEGAPLLELYGFDNPPASEELVEHVELGDERTPKRDVGFGLRQLVDVAVRALSPGINDPATAVQVIDQLHDLLRRVAGRELAYAHRYDQEGVLRVFVRTLTWEEMMLFVDEVRMNGSRSIPVTRRLRAMLEDLLTAAPESRQEALRRQMDLLDRTIEDSFDAPYVQEAARTADQRGTGF